VRVSGGGGAAVRAWGAGAAEEGPLRPPFPLPLPPATHTNTRAKHCAPRQHVDLRRQPLQRAHPLVRQLYLITIIDLLIKTEKQEYGKEITDIQKEFKDYKKEKEYNDNILTILVNEEGELKNQLDKNSLYKKILTDKVEQDRMKLQRDIDIASGKKVGGRSEIRKLMRGGDRKPNKYYEDKYVQIKKLNESIDALINKIAEIEGKEDADKDPFSKKKGIFGDTDDEYHSIYNSIWKDYKKEMNKIKSKGVTLDSLKQDERLYERIKENNLDPQDVLKITFQDKVIFICIILIIRTFSLVLIELLIEYIL
jgi:predicted  nucleic acid-binding Zn-ribbon protein